MTYLYIFLCSFMVSLLFAHLATVEGDRFQRYKKKGISCLGGIAIYAGFLAAILASLFLKEISGSKPLGVILSSGLVLLLGLIDDITNLRPCLKIIGEILGIAVLIAFGFVTKIMFLPAWANIIVTILWVLFITNAVNLLDIMDGLASGLVVIISLTLLYVSIVNNDVFSALILIALIGAHLGFLKYNYPPAKIYMGDTGSLFSGFLLAVMAINISYAPFDRPVALLTPIIALSLPIYDTVFLILMRLKKQKPIFNKTKDHFALRLVTMGYSVKKSVWTMYIFSLFLAIASLIVAFGSNTTGAVTVAVVLLVFIMMGKKVGIVKME